MKIFRSIFVFAVVGISTLMSSQTVFGQSIFLDPGSGEIGMSNTINPQVKIKNPTSAMNAVAVRLEIPDNLSVVSVTQESDDAYEYLDPCDTNETYISGNMICFDVAKLGGVYFADGDTLISFTLQPKSVGRGELVVQDGTELVDADTLQSYLVSGTVVSYTVTEGSSAYTPVADPGEEGTFLEVVEQQNEIVEPGDNGSVDGDGSSGDSEEDEYNVIEKIIGQDMGSISIGGLEIESVYLIALGVILILVVIIISIILIIRQRGAGGEAIEEPMIAKTVKPSEVQQSQGQQTPSQQTSGQNVPPQSPGASPLQ